MSDNIRGAIAMSLAMAAFSLNDLLIKLILQDLPLGQVMVLRGLASAVLALFMLSHIGGLGRIRDLGHPAVLVRSLFECGATLLFLTALANISIAMLTSTLQVMPLIATALAAILLKEPVGWRRWSATIVGLIGVLIIVAPIGPSAVFNPYALLGLAAAFFAAARDISTRFAPASTPGLLLAFSIILAGTVLGGIVSGVEAARGSGWRPVSPTQTLQIAVASVALVIAHYLITRAMRIGEMAVVGPFRYVMVLWGILWSWSVFHEPPTMRTVFGVSIVVAAGLYTLRREQIRLRDAAAAGPAVTSGTHAGAGSAIPGAEPKA